MQIRFHRTTNQEFRLKCPEFVVLIAFSKNSVLRFSIINKTETVLFTLVDF